MTIHIIPLSLSHSLQSNTIQSLHHLLKALHSSIPVHTLLPTLILLLLYKLLLLLLLLLSIMSRDPINIINIILIIIIFLILPRQINTFITSTILNLAYSLFKIHFIPKEFLTIIIIAITIDFTTSAHSSARTTSIPRPTSYTIIILLSL